MVQKLLNNVEIDYSSFEEYIPINIIGLTELEDLHIIIDRKIYEKEGEYIWICQN